MAGTDDYELALKLQREFDNEINNESKKQFKKPLEMAKQQKPLKRSNPHSNLDEEFLNRTQNLVHPMWETLDPTPDVKALFRNFDDKFFQSRLRCVTLEWSKRMYSCAGICYSRSNRFGKEITIRLSEPLLKLRPRKNLVETMLHEMIHAYCFVLSIREGNGGYGPVFKKIMVSINKVAGTNITVYHTFSDEVNLYKQHWWRCNGSCQNRAPFFGFVKRTSNRAPSPNDQWWASHQATCGGTFLKIKEPEKKKKTTGTKDEKRNTAAGDIRKFITNSTTTVTSSGSSSGPKGFGSSNGPKGPLKANGGGTILLNPRQKTTATSKEIRPTSSIAFPPTSYPGLSSDPFMMGSTSSTPRTSATSNTGGNLRNVVGFRDLNSDGIGSGNSKRKPVAGFDSSSGGFTLSGPSSSNSRPNDKRSLDSSSGQADREHLRALWSKRFSSTDDSQSKEKNNELQAGNNKRPRLEDSSGTNNDTQAKKNNWEVVDDDVMIKESSHEIFTISSDEEEASDEINLINDEHDGPSTSNSSNNINGTKHLSGDERRKAIKQEIMDETQDLTDDSDIVLIDDEYDDNNTINDLTIASELADTSVIDEFFSDDTLLKDFLLENDLRPTFSTHVPNPADDIITCPICQNKMKRAELDEHLNGCTGIAVTILLPKHILNKVTKEPKRKAKPKQNRKNNAKDILRDAGYTEEDLAAICLDSSADDDSDILHSTTLGSSDTSVSDLTSPDGGDTTSRAQRQRSIYKTTRQCPVCAQEIEENEMNDHLDDCLKNKS